MNVILPKIKLCPQDLTAVDDVNERARQREERLAKLLNAVGEDTHSESVTSFICSTKLSKNQQNERNKSQKKRDRKNSFGKLEPLYPKIGVCKDDSGGEKSMSEKRQKSEHFLQAPDSFKIRKSLSPRSQVGLKRIASVEVESSKHFSKQNSKSSSIFSAPKEDNNFLRFNSSFRNLINFNIGSVTPTIGADRLVDDLDRVARLAIVQQNVNEIFEKYQNAVLPLNFDADLQDELKHELETHYKNTIAVSQGASPSFRSTVQPKKPAASLLESNQKEEVLDDDGGAVWSFLTTDANDVLILKNQEEGNVSEEIDEEMQAEIKGQCDLITLVSNGDFLQQDFSVEKPKIARRRPETAILDAHLKTIHLKLRDIFLNWQKEQQLNIPNNITALRNFTRKWFFRCNFEEIRSLLAPLLVAPLAPPSPSFANKDLNQYPRSPLVQSPLRMMTFEYPDELPSQISDDVFTSRPAFSFVLSEDGDREAEPQLHSTTSTTLIVKTALTRRKSLLVENFDVNDIPDDASPTAGRKQFINLRQRHQARFASISKERKMEEELLARAKTFISDLEEEEKEAEKGLPTILANFVEIGGASLARPSTPKISFVVGRAALPEVQSPTSKNLEVVSQLVERPFQIIKHPISCYYVRRWLKEVEDFARPPDIALQVFIPQLSSIDDVNELNCSSLDAANCLDEKTESEICQDLQFVTQSHIENEEYDTLFQSLLNTLQQYGPDQFSSMLKSLVAPNSPKASTLPSVRFAQFQTQTSSSPRVQTFIEEDRISESNSRPSSVFDPEKQHNKTNWKRASINKVFQTPPDTPSTLVNKERNSSTMTGTSTSERISFLLKHSASSGAILLPKKETIRIDLSEVKGAGNPAARWNPEVVFGWRRAERNIQIVGPEEKVDDSEIEMDVLLTAFACVVASFLVVLCQELEVNEEEHFVQSEPCLPPPPVHERASVSGSISPKARKPPLAPSTASSFAAYGFAHKKKSNTSADPTEPKKVEEAGEIAQVLNSAIIASPEAAVPEVNNENLLLVSPKKKKKRRKSQFKKENSFASDESADFPHEVEKSEEEDHLEKKPASPSFTDATLSDKSLSPTRSAEEVQQIVVEKPLNLSTQLSVHVEDECFEQIPLQMMFTPATGIDALPPSPFHFDSDINMSFIEKNRLRKKLKSGILNEEKENASLNIKSNSIATASTSAASSERNSFSSQNHTDDEFNNSNIPNFGGLLDSISSSNGKKSSKKQKKQSSPLLNNKISEKKKIVPPPVVAIIITATDDKRRKSAQLTKVSVSPKNNTFNLKSVPAKSSSTSSSSAVSSLPATSKPKLQPSPSSSNVFQSDKKPTTVAKLKLSKSSASFFASNDKNSKKVFVKEAAVVSKIPHSPSTAQTSNDTALPKRRNTTIPSQPSQVFGEIADETVHKRRNTTVLHSVDEIKDLHKQSTLLLEAPQIKIQAATTVFLEIEGISSVCCAAAAIIAAGALCAVFNQAEVISSQLSIDKSEPQPIMITETKKKVANDDYNRSLERREKRKFVLRTIERKHIDHSFVAKLASDSADDEDLGSLEDILSVVQKEGGRQLPFQIPKSITVLPEHVNSWEIAHKEGANIGLNHLFPVCISSQALNNSQSDNSFISDREEEDRPAWRLANVNSETICLVHSPTSSPSKTPPSSSPRIIHYLPSVTHVNPVSNLKKLSLEGLLIVNSLHPLSARESNVKDTTPDELTPPFTPSNAPSPKLPSVVSRMEDYTVRYNERISDRMRLFQEKQNRETVLQLHLAADALANLSSGEQLKCQNTPISLQLTTLPLPPNVAAKKPPAPPPPWLLPLTYIPPRLPTPPPPIRLIVPEEMMSLGFEKTGIFARPYRSSQKAGKDDDVGDVNVPMEEASDEDSDNDTVNSAINAVELLVHHNKSNADESTVFTSENTHFQNVTTVDVAEVEVCCSPPPNQTEVISAAASNKKSFSSVNKNSKPTSSFQKPQLSGNKVDSNFAQEATESSVSKSNIELNVTEPVFFGKVAATCNIPISE